MLMSGFLDVTGVANENATVDVPGEGTEMTKQPNGQQRTSLFQSRRRREPGLLSGLFSLARNM